MCIIRRIIAYLCLNMINSYAVEFSERRSEEVNKFLLALSVYIYTLFSFSKYLINICLKVKNSVLC